MSPPEALITRSAILILVGLCGCGDPESPNGLRDDAFAGANDAATGRSTHITGSLGGTQFSLTFGAIQRGASPIDPVWFCVTDVELEYDACAENGGPNRFVLLGAFAYNSSNEPRLGRAETWLHRIQAQRVSAMLVSGTIAVFVDDVDSGALEATIDADFGELPVTMGPIALP